MNSNNPSPEFRELVARLCDGELTPDEAQRLEAIASTDDEAMQYYLQYLDLHGTMRRYATAEGAPQGAPLGDVPLAGLAGVEGAVLFESSAESPAKAPIVFDPANFSSPWKWFTGGAAFAFGVALLAFLLWKPAGELNAAREKSGKSPATSAETTTAYLTSSAGCAWGAGSQRLQTVGAVQLGEEIALQEGIAEFRLTNGVYFSVEGPAGLVLTSPDSLVLQYGKLTTHVPWPVKEYRITAGACRLTASDAEFGVNVTGGRVDAHVFSGEVLATNAMLDDLEPAAGDHEAVSSSPRSRKAFTKEVIAEGRALALTIQSNVMQVLRWSKATPSLFATKLTMSGTLPISKAYVDAVLAAAPRGYWRFESNKDGMVESEVRGISDLEIVGDLRLSGLAGNRVAEFRPGADGHLISRDRLDVLSQTDYSVELWVKPSHVHSGDVLALCATNKEWNVLLIELQGTGNSQPRASFSRTNPCSIRFLHRDPPAGSYLTGTSLLSTKPYSVRRWQHLVAVKRGDQMELYVDGQVVAQGVDHTSLHEGLRLVLGGQDPNEIILPFYGQLDELAIYSKALGKDEILKHYKLVDWTKTAPVAEPDA